MNENDNPTIKRIIEITSELAQIERAIEEIDPIGYELRSLEDEQLALDEERTELIDEIGETSEIKEAAEAALADAIVNSDALTPGDDVNVVYLMALIEDLDGNC